jgi:hypothetical protein
LGSLHVITGTLRASSAGDGAGPESYRVDRGHGQEVTVPSAFYKVLFSEADGGQAMTVVYENAAPGEPRSGPVLRSVDSLEAISGLDFFPDMAAERQRRIEAAAPDLDFWDRRLAMADGCSSRRSAAASPQGDRAAGP